MILHERAVRLLSQDGEKIEEDKIQFLRVLVGPSSFENVSGGTTNVQFFYRLSCRKIIIIYLEKQS